MPNSDAPQPQITVASEEVHHAQQVVMLAMATLAELRESDTESHLLRVRAYVRAMVTKLQTLPQFATVLTDVYAQNLIESAPFYDMGTIGVPDRILLKPGRLNADELAIMQMHPGIAHAAILRAEKTLGRYSPLLQITRELVLCHQERWDGTGYPHKLAGAAIPISARIIAIADVYDALISNKVYREGMPHDQAVGVIFGERGSHFDPDMVDAFIEIQDEFSDIAQRYADTEDDMQAKIEYMANAIAEQAVL